MFNKEFFWIDGKYLSKLSQEFNQFLKNNSVIYRFDDYKILNQALDNLSSYIEDISSKLKDKSVETIFTTKDIELACKKLLETNNVLNGTLTIALATNLSLDRFPSIIIAAQSE